MRAWSRRRRPLLAAVAVAASLTLSAAPAGAVVGDCEPAASWAAPRLDLAGPAVELVNAHRTSLGAETLTSSSSLARAALWKARHMAAYGYMAHDDPGPPFARSTGERIEACGYPADAGWGENIAYGYGTAEAVVSGWLDSPGHRANIEHRSYRVIGVAAAASASGTVYWAQVFGTHDDSTAAAAPTVTQTAKPPRVTASRRASFTWRTSGTVTRTTCALDRRGAAACAPRRYARLAPGRHTFRVTVSNGAGSSTATYSWRIR